MSSEVDTAIRDLITERHRQKQYVDYGVDHRGKPQIYPRDALSPAMRGLLRAHPAEAIAIFESGTLPPPSTTGRRPPKWGATYTPGDGVRDGEDESSGAGPATTPTQTGESLLAAKGDTCPYCNCPCVGPTDRWYRVLHWSDPVEIERRTREATERHIRTVAARRQYGVPDPRWP